VEGGEITARHSASLAWEPFLDPQEMATLTRPPESLAPTALLRYIRYLEETGQRADTWALALWKKAGTGLLTLAMLILALVFSLAGRRFALGTRLVLAAATGLAIFLLDQLAANAGLLLGLPPALTGVGPGAVLLAASLWALRRYA
jgi:lipopolysaccharide export system permease protein